MIFFRKDDTRYSLRQVGEDRYKISVQNDRAQGVTQELSEAELKEFIENLIDACNPPAEANTSRADALLAALRDYVESQGKTIESVDKECSSVKPPLSREEWLAAQLGPEDLEEVLAGKMSVAEALADVEIEEEEDEAPV